MKTLLLKLAKLLVKYGPSVAEMVIEAKAKQEKEKE